MPDFDTVLDATQAAVRAYVAGLGVPLSDVDDVAQEVYLDFHRAMGRLPADVEPLAWLKGMARKRALNFFRRLGVERQRRVERVAEALSRAPEAPPPAADGGALRRCIERLAPRSQRAVALRYEEGATSAAIGQALGMTAEAVRILLMRVRGTLKECLEHGA
jgi:RNA polymerase sigma-70 factor (ECF subfamily)